MIISVYSLFELDRDCLSLLGQTIGYNLYTYLSQLTKNRIPIPNSTNTKFQGLTSNHLTLFSVFSS